MANYFVHERLVVSCFGCVWGFAGDSVMAEGGVGFEWRYGWLVCLFFVCGGMLVAVIGVGILFISFLIVVRPVLHNDPSRDT